MSHRRPDPFRGPSTPADGAVAPEDGHPAPSRLSRPRPGPGPGSHAAPYLALALAAIPLLASCAPSGTRSFERRTALEDSAYTSANVELGDVDGDGWLDLILVKGRHWPLANLLLRGDGQGGFHPAEPVGTAEDRSYSGLLVDLDADGDPDLVVSNDAPDPKRIYRNDGAGRFTEVDRFGEPGWTTRHVAAGDVDGDGIPDMIVANRSADGTAASFVCPGRGDGGLVEPCASLGPGSSTTITPADMDGDGDVDLVRPYRDGGQSVVLLNDGSGAFPDRVAFGPPDASIRSAGAGDFDGDGRMDLVAIGAELGPVVFMGRADGGFGEGRRLPDEGAQPYSLLVTDLDADGRPDIVVGYVESRSIVFFTESPGWTPVPFGDDEGVTYGFAAGDVDRDGFTDLAEARSGAVNLLWYGAPARR